MNRVTFGIVLALFSLVLHCLTSTEATTLHMHCVTPAATDPLLRPPNTYTLQNYEACPTRSTTLAELVGSTIQDIKSSTTIVFLPGKHLMPRNSTLYVTDVEELVFTGQESSESLPEIDCQGTEAAFQLINIDGLSISKLKFSNCGKLLSYEPSKSKMATLFLANITNLVIQHLEITNGIGYGLHGVNIVGNSTIVNSHFANNTDGGNTLLEYFDLDQVSCMSMHHLLIMNSSFTMGQSTLQLYSQEAAIGAGLSIQLKQRDFLVNITLLRTSASSNIAGQGPNFQVDSFSSAPHIIALQDCVARNGTALYSGGSGFAYRHLHKSLNLLPCRDTFIPNRTLILLNNTRFTDGKGGKNPSSLSEFASNAILATFFVSKTGTVLHTFSIQNCNISNNIGDSGVGFYSQISNGIPGSLPLKGFVEIEIIRSSFWNNTSTTFKLNEWSVIKLVDLDSVKIAQVQIFDNSGSGIVAVNSNMYFDGTSNVSNNSAYNGGGIALHGDSFIHLKPYTVITLVSNKAINTGGGIYVAQTIDTTVTSQCFFQFFDDVGTSKQDIANYTELQFSNNSAGLGRR